LNELFKVYAGLTQLFKIKPPIWVESLSTPPGGTRKNFENQKSYKCTFDTCRHHTTNQHLIPAKITQRQTNINAIYSQKHKGINMKTTITILGLILTATAIAAPYKYINTTCPMQLICDVVTKQPCQVNYPTPSGTWSARKPNFANQGTNFFWRAAYIPAPITRGIVWCEFINIQSGYISVIRSLVPATPDVTQVNNQWSQILSPISTSTCPSIYPSSETSSDNTVCPIILNYGNK